MKIVLTKILQIVVAFSALVIMIGYVTSQPVKQPQSIKLVSASFNPGDIIDYGVFTDYESMSAQDIQNFLNAEVTNCDTNGTQSFTAPNGQVMTHAQWGALYDSENNTNTGAAPYVCLENYVENPNNGQNNLQNPTANIPGGESAAQIIYNAAQEYQINPQVILTTLQKEQGLVTDNWPWLYEYTEAMGFNCPDDGGCSGYPGFYQQVNAAAAQFRNYLNNPNDFNYTVGNNKILYSPNCSSSSTVYIQNQATAALYDYTPYQPDSNVLANTNPIGSTNGPGGAVSGDSCASYGNRNFWWYFNTWFGSSLSPSYTWEPVSQAVYTDASMTDELGWDATLQANSSAYVVVNALNTGNVTWSNSGAYPIHLGTDDPTDRNSVFCTTGWLECGGRPADLLQSSVAPGQVGTFEFPIRAPLTAGIYDEHFNLVAEGLTWFNDPGQYFIFTVTPEQYTWQLESQAVYTDASMTDELGWDATLQANSSAYVVVNALNTGNFTWTQTGPNAVELGTDMPTDRASPFCTDEWNGCNRPALLEQSSVAPGQVGTFEFPITAPLTAGTYDEHFNLVGPEWFNDLGQYFIFTVTPE